MALFFVAVWCLVPIPLLAQADGQAPAAGAKAVADVLSQEGYVAPPPELASAVLAPRHLNVALASPSPDGKWFLDEVGDGPVPMSVFSKPFHELGGVFVDYKANRLRTLTIRNSVGIDLISAADGTKRSIPLPEGTRVSNPAWSPDGTQVAFFVHGDDATHIWVADVATLKVRRVTPRPVLATLATTFQFSKDGRSIAAVLLPEKRPLQPVPPLAPAGPALKLAEEKDRNRLRTFASLMATPYDFQLLKWHGTGQLAVIDLAVPVREARGRDAAKGTRPIGAPALVRSFDLSPDGKYVRVTRLAEPFSYVVPVASFGTVEEVWDLDGKLLAKVSERPLDLGVQDAANTPPDPGAGPGGGPAQQQGKREIAWRADGQGLTYLEQDPPPARDRDAGGRGAGAAPGAEEGDQDRPQASRRRDRVFQWLPPFEEKGAKAIYESNTRMSNHRYSPDMQILFASERSGQNTVEYAVYLNETSKRYTLARFRTDDVYANPGMLVRTRSASDEAVDDPEQGPPGGRGAVAGGSLVHVSADGTAVFYQGTAYDKDPLEHGPKTFIDRVAIKTGEKKRVYESENNGIFERVAAVLDPEAGRLLVSRESNTEVPQQFLVEGSRRVQLTRNQDYTPDVTRAPRERFVVERPDGFKFRVTVTMPPGHVKGQRLPALFWFYPREYAGQEEYDRGGRTFNRNEFPNFGTRSMQYFVRLGYAVVEPDSPIVGPQGQMNNNYEHDLRNNLAAVIDELDRRGIADRARLGIGGHSYGAFSTVNAMVHTPFFKAGIAGDGAYNRTLTPLGFQSERRDLWEARDVYLSMSPFLFANNLTGALLMYHGLGDQNVGTDPVNSTRLFHALNGLGKPVALYMYPLEDHGPAAKETLLDLWARWAAWLDKYVKSPQPAKTATGESK
ncbi:MAG TPA: prolyl oligopeptidase family serine peptidase [Vicinamibacterales bacterium]|nr:prolyl oligopeptidase family serine peptidase [Vicinamibacterales bacterium]